MNLGASKTTRSDFKKKQSKNLPGLIHEFVFPHNAEQLQSTEFGVEWLTKAFQATQAIPSNVQVKEIVSLIDISKKVGGGAGDKALLEVAYSDPAFDQASTKFFIKFPCADIKKKWRAAMLDQSGPEVLFAHLFSSPTSPEQADEHFPVRTVKLYFCDINPVSTNFILIQEFLPYGDGQGGPGSILAPAEKFKPYLLEGGEDQYYRVLMDATAKMCGWYHTIASSPLGATIRKSFPNKTKKQFPKKCRGLLRFFIYWIGRSFMFFSMDFIKTTCPQLCPKDILTKESLAQIQKQYEEVLCHFPEIMSYVLAKGQYEYFAYGHPNLDVDNVFFYRDENNQLTCGGLDFGGYQGGNILLLLAGVLGGTSDNYFCENEESLIKRFATQYKAEGGPTLNPDQVYKDWKLLHAMKFLISSLLSVAAPKKISSKVLREINDVKDPRFAENFEGRSFTSLVISSFVRWKNGNAYDYFKQWQQDTSQKARGGLTWNLLYRPLHGLHTLFMRTVLFFYRMFR